MSIATDGAFNNMLGDLADMVAACPTFQTLVGATEVDDDAGNLATARALVGLYGQPKTAHDGPFAVVDIDGWYGGHSVSSGCGMTYAQRGSTVIHIESPIGEDIEGDEAAFVWMAQIAGKIMGEMMTQSGVGPVLPLHKIGKLEGPTISNENEVEEGRPKRAWYALACEVGV